MIQDVIKFVVGKVPIEKYIICNPGTFDPMKHLEIVMPLRKCPVEELTPDDVIVLDNELTLVVIQKLLWPLINIAEPNNNNQIMQFLYK